MTEQPQGQTPRPVRVLLVDDHALVRAGLIALIDSADDLVVVGEAADGQQAVDLTASTEPDVVLMDLSMPVLDGIAATRQIVTHRPGTQVLVLTSFSDRARVRDALAAGAIGYLLKDSTPQEVLNGIRAAAALGSPIDPRVARTLLTDTGPGAPAQLSPREQEVIALVTRGLPNKQIARTLGISERTVKVHLGNIFRRIGVQDRTSAAMWAREHLPPDERG